MCADFKFILIIIFFFLRIKCGGKMKRKNSIFFIYYEIVNIVTSVVFKIEFQKNFKIKIQDFLIE